MKVTLGKEHPVGYRRFRNKAVWYLNAWTTKAEADAAKKKEQSHKRSATIVTSYRTVNGRSQKLYLVYSSN